MTERNFHKIPSPFLNNPSGLSFISKGPCLSNIPWCARWTNSLLLNLMVGILQRGFKLQRPPWYLKTFMKKFLYMYNIRWQKCVVHISRWVKQKSYMYTYKRSKGLNLTVTWVSETLHWLLVTGVHFCISTS